MNGFTLAFPFLIFFSILFAWQHRKINPADAMLAASMLFCIVWVLLLVLFIDGTEGNRIRFATEPFVFLLVAKLIDIRRSRAIPSAG